VLARRYGLHGPVGSLSEIGRELGVTRERVRQIEIEALRKLRQSSHRPELAALTG